ncbi:MAG: dihydropteroate synthase [Actinomycetota bacterium]|nr:dihydropteroate synthase [Actinomycetota bacterium]
MRIPVREWHARGDRLSNARRTLIMGVLNVTPDSFSDGGRFLDPTRAVEHGQELWDQGADLVDVGGESTRPGAEAVPVQEELRRVLPVVGELAHRGVRLSIDTSKAEVAARALEVGAAVVNDVTALGDPDMARVVAESGAGLVLMHMQGTPRTMQVDPRYDDVVGEVKAFLLARAEAARDAGIQKEQICLDPGIGFGKRLEHNLLLLARLDVLVGTGFAVLFGASRKSFIGTLLGGVPVEQREEGTAATVALGVGRGATMVRVHDVLMGRRAACLADAIVRSAGEDGMAWPD